MLSRKSSQLRLVAGIFSTLVCTVLPCRADSSPLRQTSDLHSAGERRPPLLALLPFAAVEPNERGVRRLADLEGVKATRQLLSWAAGPEIQKDPRMRLEMVRALNDRTRGPKRERVINSLLTLLQPQGSIAAPMSTPLDNGVDVGGLSRFIRGSAALALARSQHPRALRVLIIEAAQGVNQDPMGSALARDALSAFPLNKTLKEELSVLLSDSLVTAAFRAEPAPKAAVPQDPIQLLHMKKSIARWSHAIELLRKADHLPDSFQKLDIWQASLAKDAAWTLRAWSLLSLKISPKVLQFARDQATTLVRDPADNTRAAAAWALANLSAVEAAELLKTTNDPIIVAALLRQAASGPLALEAYQWALRRTANAHQATPKPALITQALSISLWEPQNWTSTSTASLWSPSRRNAPSVSWIAALSARLSEGEATNQGTSFTVVRDWLTSENRSTRAAAAVGLAYSQSPSSAGLLLRAYRTETDVLVRRKIVRSLLHHPLIDAKDRKLVRQLDPDAHCRTLARGEAPGGEASFFVDQGKPGSRVVMPDEARQAQVESAPDGFVGIIYAPD